MYLFGCRFPFFCRNDSTLGSSFDLKGSKPSLEAEKNLRITRHRNRSDNVPATIPASQMNSTARHSKNSICKEKNAPLVSVETHQIIAQKEDAIYLYSCHWLVDSRYFFFRIMDSKTCHANNSLYAFLLLF